MSNLVEHAKRELETAGLLSKDSDYGGLLGESVLEIVEVFAKQGHSGMSASVTVSLLEKLLRFKPLSPLTGDDSEWNEVGDGEYQNNRCSHVFKNAEGAYDIEGRIFREQSGSCYTGYESRVPVEFPYVPKRESVDVPDKSE